MVVSILLTYTKPFTAEQTGRGALVVQLPWNFERDEYSEMPSEHKHFLLRSLSQNVKKRHRKPTCLIIGKQTFLECWGLLTILTSKKVHAAAIKQKQHVISDLCHHLWQYSFGKRVHYGRASYGSSYYGKVWDPQVRFKYSSPKRKRPYLDTCKTKITVGYRLESTRRDLQLVSCW